MLDGPRCKASLGLVQAMVEAGIRVVVPDACVAEAAEHASLAHQTVTYFGPRIHGLGRAQAPGRIQNAFALGWYFRSLMEATTFERYIANYYERSAPAEYMGAGMSRRPCPARWRSVT